MSEAVLNRKIKYWEDQLLDLGKRNKMISFKETKRSTLKILYPDFENLYQKIVVNEQTLTFQKAVGSDYDRRVYSIITLLDKLSSPIDVYIGDIRAAGTLPETDKTLKHLRSKARLAIDEQGINILYLIFGFIEWQEKSGTGNPWIRSPLILVPVSLQLPFRGSRFSLKWQEEEIVANPNLTYLFKRDYGITIPDFDSDKDSLEDFMQGMEDLVKDRGWRIVRECSLGLVSFLKISMYNDLITHEDELRYNPVIRAFAGEQNAVSKPADNLYKFDLDTCRSADSCLVLDADSSQQTAIMLSHNGVSFVLQGPPGTGKSQTIANIIAQGLADGKKILFVSEKMAALEVVYRRLSDVQLADFCLALHSHKANKKEVLQQLESNLNLQQIRVKQAELAKLTQLDVLKEQLRDYAQDIHTHIMPLEMSIYEVYGAIMELENLPDIRLTLPDVDKFSRDQLDRLAILVMNFDKAKDTLGPKWYKNPWQGIVCPGMELSRKRELKNSLQNTIRVIAMLDACTLKEKTLADALSLDMLDRFAEMYKSAEYCTQIPHSWFSRPTDQEECLIRTLQKNRDTINARMDILEQVYTSELFSLNGTELLDIYQNTAESVRCNLGDSFAEDAVFSQLDTLYQQVQQLYITISFLIDSIAALNKEYGMNFEFSYDSFETLFQVCDLLQQKRNITESYFDHSRIRQYTDSIHQKLQWLEGRKIWMENRYTESLLFDPELDQHVQNLNSAEKFLSSVNFADSSEYEAVRRISTFDTAGLRRIPDVLHHPVMDKLSQQYDIQKPRTLNEIFHQIFVLEKLPDLKVAARWNSAQGRETARQLIEEVNTQNTLIRRAREQLKVCFDTAGILIDVQKFTPDDLGKLRQAHETIPEAAVILESCMNPEAYILLDEIKCRIAEFQSIQEKIRAFRSEYHVLKTVNDVQLLQTLQEKQPVMNLYAPREQWLVSEEETVELLEQLIERADILCQQHTKLSAVYEDSVFSLDYLPMLNRFKAEYTGPFRFFKSAYREDVKQIRLLYRDVRKKISESEIISLLQTLRQYNEDMERYQGLSTAVSSLLGVQKYDIYYDWKRIRNSLQAFTELCQIFSDAEDTYRFISDGAWEDTIAGLNRLEELNGWFLSAEQPEAMYGNLYRQQETDTEKIRELLENVRELSALFVTPGNYAGYMENTDDGLLQEIQKQASVIFDTEKWFQNRISRIQEFTGENYQEGAEPWDRVLQNLESYAAVVELSSEQSAWQLTAHYTEAAEILVPCLDVLHKLAGIEDCAKSIYQVKTLGETVANMELGDLTGQLCNVVESAASVFTAYTYLSGFSCLNVSDFNIADLADDLRSVQKYRDALKEQPLLERVGQFMLGSDYDGIQTDWDSVDVSISMCEKVTELLGGTVPKAVITAFVDKSSICSEDQIEELQQRILEAEDIEKVFQNISRIEYLDARLPAISDAKKALESAIDVQNKLSQCARLCRQWNDVITDLQYLAELQQTETYFSENLAAAQALMPEFALSADTSWLQLQDSFAHMNRMKHMLKSYSYDPELVCWLTGGIPESPVARYKSEVEKLLQNRQDFLNITSLFDNQATLESFDLKRLGRRFQNCDDQFTTMDAWIDFRDCKAACQENGLEDFILEAEDTFYPEGTLKDIFLKAFYYAWIEKICAGIPSVAKFKIRAQTSRVDTFRQLNTHQLSINQLRIRELLIQKMPTRDVAGRARDEMSILLHELSKKRNIIPLRKLFRRIPNLLLRLKPCLMMSPLSVSYFLEADTYKFDMVIFDEASQIFQQDAIGAIFRGSQVIIAGDSKQLPPTNFFSASSNLDGDYDGEEYEEECIAFDSILEEAAGYLPNHTLLWHYRSRYEDLITFSNQEIYQNNLITFPSCITQVPDTGVESIYVANGVYENRANKAEAAEIVRLVDAHIRNHPKRSLGVIAFSESQQSVIEDEINKYCRQHPQNEWFFDENADEPFFVKNLENVQGDERDTIFFSICYGKNTKGRMYMRFGPLGVQGGERRLNVAITRARENLKIVVSIRPEDIDLSKTTSEGVRMLRSCLNFAIHGNSVLNRNKTGNRLYDVDSFSKQVAHFLTGKGFKLQTDTGTSDYTIDIAVEHPDRPGHFIAGVECDGNSYYMARTVRDRDHLRTVVLEKMGWKMYRVWSTEWIRNPEAEQARLLEFLNTALAHYDEENPEKISTSSETDTVETETIRPVRKIENRNTENPYNLPRYVEGNCYNIRSRRGSDKFSLIADMIHTVVEVEQPLHMELLYKRIASGLPEGKATQSVRNKIDKVIRELMKNEVVIENQFIRLVTLTRVTARMSEAGHPARPAEYISIPEIAAAVVTILTDAFGMEVNVLCSQVAYVFGYERSGSRMRQRTNEAIDYLVKTRKVSLYDGKVQLLN